MITRAVIGLGAFVAAGVVGVVGVVGCSSGDGDANDLAAASETEARAVVRSALEVLRQGDVEGVLRTFCDQTPEGRALALEILRPAAGRKDLDIVRSEAAWKGNVPFFYVEVQSADGQGYVHGFGVRVRDGCLDRAVGATVLPDPRRSP